MSLNIDEHNARVEKFFPAVLSKAKEFQAIAAVENLELNQLYKKAVKWLLNTFVFDLDIDGAKHWENMLGIIPEAGDSLSKRKQKILIVINHSLPYTERSFQNMLDSVYGAGNVREIVEYDKYAVWLDVAAGLMFKVKELLNYVRPIIPVNMGIYVRNTKTANLKVYFAGLISIRTVISIDSASNFNAAGLINIRAVAGYIKFRKIYKIKMEG